MISGTFFTNLTGIILTCTLLLISAGGDRLVSMARFPFSLPISLFWAVYKYLFCGAYFIIGLFYGIIFCLNCGRIDEPLLKKKDLLGTASREIDMEVLANRFGVNEGISYKEKSFLSYLNLKVGNWSPLNFLDRFLDFSCELFYNGGFMLAVFLFRGQSGSEYTEHAAEKLMPNLFQELTTYF